MRRRFIGVDPGKSGGLAAVTTSATGSIESVEAWRMPDNVADLWQCVLELAQFRDDVEPRAVLERVAATRKPNQGDRAQGAAGMFRFGQNFGQLEIALLAAGIPTELATPRQWLAQFGLAQRPKETQTAWKNRHKSAAAAIFPPTRYGLKITHANADALLIAEYCRRRNCQSLASPT